MFASEAGKKIINFQCRRHLGSTLQRIKMPPKKPATPPTPRLRAVKCVKSKQVKTKDDQHDDQEKRKETNKPKVCIILSLLLFVLGLFHNTKASLQ